MINCILNRGGPRKATELLENLAVVCEDPPMELRFGSEVQQQAYFDSRRAHVIQKLSFVNRLEGAACLQLDDDPFFDEEVSGEGADDDTLEMNFDRALPFGPYPSVLEGDNHGALINGLEKAGSHLMVYFEEGANYLLGEIPEKHEMRSR